MTYSQQFHWRMAAKWRGILWEAFADLEGDQQAAYVAEYETAMQIEAVTAYDAQKKAKKRGRNT